MVTLLTLVSSQKTGILRVVRRLLLSTVQYFIYIPRGRLLCRSLVKWNLFTSLPMTGGKCVKQCPQQTFRETTGWRCEPCHSSCQTCHGPRSTDCDLCLAGNSPLHGQCPLKNCPLGHYFDGKATSNFQP